MDNIASDRWLRNGSSLIWEGLPGNASLPQRVLSLREALAWLPTLPPEPPDGVRTIIITGLQTVVDVLPLADAATVLARVRALIRVQSRDWPETAFVFILPSSSRLESDAAGTSLLLVSLSGRATLDIGGMLWPGNVRQANRIVQQGMDARKNPTVTPIGYWLRRVS
jgi:hypothetical protein